LFICYRMLYGGDCMDFCFVENDSFNAKGRIVIQKRDLNKTIEKFIEVMKNCGVKNINISSVCNSIGTGYSLNDKIIPLFHRVDDSIFGKSGLNVQYYSWARGQDNNDEHLFEWFIYDTTQSEINEMVLFDFTSNSPKAMGHHYITLEEASKYYPTDIQNDIGLQSMMAKKDDDSANIVVYNGDTASFLDNLTRGGVHINLDGFDRDLDSMESFIRAVYILYPHTQIYVCGIPKLLKMKLPDKLVNKKIRDLCLKYPNCVYVDSVLQNGMYLNNGKFYFDIHYNQEEYLRLLTNIFSAIGNNYNPVNALIEADSILLSEGFLNTTKSSQEIENKFDELITTIFKEYQLSDDQLKRMKDCFLKRYSYDTSLDLVGSCLDIKSDCSGIKSADLFKFKDSFISAMKSIGVENVNLIGLGNSITSLLSGDSDSIDRIKCYNYSDGKSDSKNNIFEWLLKNKTQSDISGKTVDDDIGLQDIVGTHYDKLANIVVYNGYSDYAELNGFLQYTYLKNPHTQVYVCGVSSLDNERVKKVCSKYSNCVFVDVLSKNDFYFNKGVSDEVDDYQLYLLQCIMKSIVDNYKFLVALTDFDLSMKVISKDSEFDIEANRNLSEFHTYSFMNYFLNRYMLSSEEREKVLWYFKERKPHDYFHADSKIVEEMLIGKIKQNKR